MPEHRGRFFAFEKSSACIYRRNEIRFRLLLSDVFRTAESENYAAELVKQEQKKSGYAAFSKCCGQLHALLPVDNDDPDYGKSGNAHQSRAVLPSRRATRGDPGEQRGKENLPAFPAQIKLVVCVQNRDDAVPAGLSRFSEQKSASYNSQNGPCGADNQRSLFIHNQSSISGPEDLFRSGVDHIVIVPLPGLELHFIHAVLVIDIHIMNL